MWLRLPLACFSRRRSIASGTNSKKQRYPLILASGRLAVGVALLVALGVAGCGGSEARVLHPRKTAPVILAAGDIASCASQGDEATARLVARLPGTVAALGDQAYEEGSSDEFDDCYAPSWGRFAERTRPAPGNHDYNTPNAAGYFDYFGGLAGDASKGWYSYGLGAWHIVVLNSNCSYVGGCDARSPQVRWLRSDLRAHRAFCTLAYWHHPRFSSGTEHGSDHRVARFWRMLYSAGADVVLSAHEHNYERFAPQTADGKLDLRRGIREFVVGTGGKSHYPLGSPIANSEVRNDDTFGVLRLDLQRHSYTWKFVPAKPGGFTDSGSSACHP
jgi:hypothetical protein